MNIETLDTNINVVKNSIYAVRSRSSVPITRSR